MSMQITQWEEMDFNTDHSYHSDEAANVFGGETQFSNISNSDLHA